MALEKRWKMKEMKGQASAVAYHAFMSLALHLPMTKTARRLLSDGQVNALAANKDADSLDFTSAMFDALRKTPDDNKLKKLVFAELVEFADKEICEYMKMLQIVETLKGVGINGATEGNFTAGEITHMLYDAFCACLAHESEVFF